MVELMESTFGYADLNAEEYHVQKLVEIEFGEGWNDIFETYKDIFLKAGDFVNTYDESKNLIDIIDNDPLVK